MTQVGEIFPRPSQYSHVNTSMDTEAVITEIYMEGTFASLYIHIYIDFYDIHGTQNFKFLLPDRVSGFPNIDLYKFLSLQ